MNSIDRNVVALKAAQSTGAKTTAKALLWRLVWLYVMGSAAAVVTTFFLVAIGLQLTSYQWLCLLGLTPAVVPVYVLFDIHMIRKHYA
ncbi:MAG: hypothetical protein JNK21_16495, partial [Rhodospirillaceae bacterium]|nr:hypothetical protein [Rhodospirillaceae bacterium]